MHLGNAYQVMHFPRVSPANNAHHGNRGTKEGNTLLAPVTDSKRVFPENLFLFYLSTLKSFKAEFKRYEIIWIEGQSISPQFKSYKKKRFRQARKIKAK